MIRLRKIPAILVLIVLAAALGAQVFRRAPGAGKGIHLAQVIPGRLAGWTSRSLPLGPTEVVSGEVQKVLRFDDVDYREYRRGNSRFSLFVAYWNPGKMPIQVVASHTPDRCWVEGGWNCVEMDDQTILIAGLRPGRERTFRASGGPPMHVIFWHVVGGELYDFGPGLRPTPPVWQWWRDVAQGIFRSPREQYFIRLSSEEPFSELARDPGFRDLLIILGQLGLREW